MNCRKLQRSQTKGTRGHAGCVDRYTQDPNLRRSNEIARISRNPNDMYALQGWDNYHVAHEGLIAMFGATLGMTEAELIDFIADNRRRANTYEETQEDGTIVIRSSKTMKRISVTSFLNGVLFSWVLGVLLALRTILTMRPCSLAFQSLKKLLTKNKLLQ